MARYGTAAASGSKRSLTLFGLGAGHGRLELLHGLFQRPRVIRLGPDLAGTHLEPAQFDRIGLVAHFSSGDLDNRALFRRQLVEHLALEVLQKARLEIEINLHASIIRPNGLRLKDNSRVPGSA